MKYPNLSVLACFVICLQCTTPHPVAQPQLMIKLEKTGCRGTCPVFQMSVYSDRTVTFSGMAHTAASNERTTISEEEYKLLMNTFEEASFSDLDSSYVKSVADFPFTYLSYRTDRGIKKVTVRGSAPETFHRLVEKTESIAHHNHWLNGNATRSEREVIIELVRDSDPAALTDQFIDENLTFIKKITPNKLYYLFSVDAADPEDFLNKIQANPLVKAAQWNHKLKKRKE
ncbi:MAG: hypothetical protein KDC80_16195 [Saprospiraceae bacterium]|nr:hypothetical protein [Saprospiraceae bacterium]